MYVTALHNYHIKMGHRFMNTNPVPNITKTETKYRS